MDTQTKGLYLTLITGLVFVTGLLILYTLSLRNQYRQRILLSRQQLTREVELIDRERERIANDLHDELGSGLAAIGLLLQQAREKMDPGILDKAGNALHDQRKHIRQIAHNFVPRILASHGLQHALADLLDELNTHGALRLERQLNMDDRHFTVAKSVHVFRIIRELLLNILQHANASLIRFRCSQDTRYLVVQIHDNGSGWIQDQTGSGQAGWGLQTIDTRIKLLNARIDYHLEKHGGTAYRVQIPLSSMC